MKLNFETVIPWVVAVAAGLVFSTIDDLNVFKTTEVVLVSFASSLIVASLALDWALRDDFKSSPSYQFARDLGSVEALNSWSIGAHVAFLGAFTFKIFVDQTPTSYPFLLAGLVLAIYLLIQTIHLYIAIKTTKENK
jgi:hypothetical protein